MNLECYGHRDVVDIHIFDVEGKKVATLKTLKESYISADSEKPYIFVKDALLNIDLWKYICGSVEENVTDFDSTLGRKSKTKISLGKEYSKVCKVVGETFLRNAATGADELVLFEVGSAEIRNALVIEGKADNQDPSTFDIYIDIYADENGETINMYI